MPEHEAPLLNYLKATNHDVGFFFNFGLEPEFRRKVFSNNRKKIEEGANSRRFKMSSVMKDTPIIFNQ
jgi:hypothetical protein